MSVYFIKQKGWRYEFILNGARYTKAWFKTKREAREAEVKRKEEIQNPQPIVETPTDMAFLDLANGRLDYVKAYNSLTHYRDYLYMARRWVKKWGELACSQITQDMIQQFVLKRAKVSPYCANKEIRYLRATFNFGMKRKLIFENPVDGIEFLPVDKKIKYVPPAEDIDKVIAIADADTQDYLWVIRETMARMSEINRLTWDDVDFEGRYVILYTRKKKGGHLTPRKVPMTQKLHEILLRRYSDGDKAKPWVFWHTYWSSKTGEKNDGPFRDRKRIMKTLCRKAGVKYFRYHALRHFGASLMDNNNVPIGSIQRILGHENRTTTEIYLHSISEAERVAMSIYEQAQQNSHTKPHPGKEKGLQPKL
jgi:integrase